MSLLPEIANPYLQAVTWGFLFGAVVCTPTCLPYIASYIAGIGANFRKGLVVTFIFNGGRIAAYALIGTTVGLFKIAVSDPVLSSFQAYSSIAFGIVSILVGAIILIKGRRTSHNCSAGERQEIGLKKMSGRFDIGAFSLGFTRGLLLCTPLMALLAYSIPFAGPFDSFALAALFGVGTALSPILLIGGATGWLLNKAPLFRKWISIVGGGLLIVLGVSALISSLMVTNG